MSSHDLGVIMEEQSACSKLGGMLREYQMVYSGGRICNVESLFNHPICLFSLLMYYRLAGRNSLQQQISCWVKGFHINTMEIRAFILAPSLPRPDHCYLFVLMIGKALVAPCLDKKGGMISLSLCQLTQQILTWMEFNEVEISAKHNP